MRQFLPSIITVASLAPLNPSPTLHGAALLNSSQHARNEIGSAIPAKPLPQASRGTQTLTEQDIENLPRHA
ncbi:MAG: hypothetical protein AAF974_01135 [Cyanobacteria bacterium P01_E01_bin.34]